MCVHMSPGTEGVVDAKLVPVLVGKLLKEEDEIKVQMLKVSIRPTGFVWFWYLYNILKCIQTKKRNSNAFLP